MRLDKVLKRGRALSDIAIGLWAISDRTGLVFSVQIADVTEAWLVCQCVRQLEDEATTSKLSTAAILVSVGASALHRCSVIHVVDLVTSSWLQLPHGRSYDLLPAVCTENLGLVCRSGLHSDCARRAWPRTYSRAVSDHVLGSRVPPVIS